MRYQTLEEVITPNGVLEFGPVVARPVRPVQARQEFFLVDQSGRSVPFGRAAETRTAASLRKPSQRRLARQHLKAVRAPAPLSTGCAFCSLPPKMGSTP